MAEECVFTSILLSLAEYVYHSKAPLDKEQLAKMIFNILLQGSVKILGLLQDADDDKAFVNVKQSPPSKRPGLLLLSR